MLDQPSCLIVDESDVVRKIVRHTTEGLGYQTDEAATIADGLSRCKRGLPDVVIVDCHVDGASTLDFIAAVRSMPNGRNAKVLYIVTDNDPTDIGRAIAYGANDVMIKPFYKVNLEAKIAAMTVRPRPVGDDEPVYRPGRAAAGLR